MSPAADVGALSLQAGPGGPGWAADVVSETATPTPAPSEDPLRPDLEPTDVSPGLAGFLAIFAVALAAVVLFFGLSRQLRRMRHNAEVQGIPVDDRRAGHPGPAPTDGSSSDGASGTGDDATGREG
ncbi:hypothetical protein [Cellulosimicrobium cellulans]|uniref:hypothetical protein n=1 Tax=Cellulosimicrobium cellulans TaxID=1710 RepID=UPI000AB3893A|nr:hypothetical protein [Cellulosimicrobium cellulans]